MKIALGQINTTIGDFSGNVERILQLYRRAQGEGAELVVFPELSLCGYPPRDLLDRADFLDAQERALQTLAEQITEPACLLGAVRARKTGTTGKRLENSAILIHHRNVVFHQAKRLLPNYDVFDEARYFQPGDHSETVLLAGTRLGFSICEDWWNDEDYWRAKPYALNPIPELAAQGAEVLINLSASPFAYRKPRARLELLQRQARRAQRPLLYVNLVGGNDDLIFDGNSVVLNAQGEIVAELPSFEEAYRLVDTQALHSISAQRCCEKATLLDALILGMRDYFRKCGFRRCVLGLSGGIDSALAAWIAVAALGPENVLGVALPSPFSSPGSVDDAESLAAALRIELRRIPIHELFYDYCRSLQLDPQGSIDTTLQNVQSRIRGNLLMALSNRENRLLLSTGNKSELAMGYCTLYGDMAGALAPLGDLYKTQVYELARIANARQRAIPESSLTKAPSAELAPGQKDQDDLPPYSTLDAILRAYLEENSTPEQIVASGYEPSLVHKILRRLDQNEYKRQQAPVILKVNPRSFGSGRRVPIAQSYRA